MLFNSYEFIIYFLPLTLLICMIAKKLGRVFPAKVFLIAASLFFYGYFHVSYTLILIVSILLNYSFSRLLAKELPVRTKKLVLGAGILLNLGLIFYFKYFRFFIENMNHVIGREVLELPEILLPLGISFFTFQQISYLVDSYRGKTAEYGFLDYALFVTFFPQLIAGPIVLHDEMIPQFADRKNEKPYAEDLARGLCFFAVGLFKKVMIADVLGRGVDWGYGNIEILSGLEAFLTSILYTFQIYFDFSGYCDMAMGIASMFRIRLPLNFNSPYKARSIPEFWQRWHMTLYRFLRQYIYFPLGGSRKGALITARNVMIVFLVSGIWHGAAWTFIIWGVLHGLASVLHRWIGKWWERVPCVLQWLATFLFVDLAWVIFRAGSVKEALGLYRKMLQPKFTVSNAFLEQFQLVEFTYLRDHLPFLRSLAQSFPILPLGMALGVAGVLAILLPNIHEKEFQPGIANALLTIILLCWAILSLSSLSVFLYFNF